MLIFAQTDVDFPHLASVWLGKKKKKTLCDNWDLTVSEVQWHRAMWHKEIINQHSHIQFVLAKYWTWAEVNMT